MNALAATLALIGGIVVGTLLAFPLLIVYAGIWIEIIHPLGSFLPRDPSPTQLLVFLVALYAIWVGLVILTVRALSGVKPAHIFFLSVPWPSLLFSYWHSYLGL